MSVQDVPTCAPSPQLTPSSQFDPLSGMSPSAATGAAVGQPSSPSDLQARRAQAKGIRVSTIEVAIRAQAKRFLAHPLVVQHLEAIWAGTIIFHSEADNLHRKPSAQSVQHRGRSATGYGTIVEHSPSALPADAVTSKKSQKSSLTKQLAEKPITRRWVTLYDPREASLFKLSRLRVPRYRQVFSTFSFATMLGLFIAVLVDRSLDITPLEVVFWFWSLGYMLDEVVGFTEQGFGLYILSFWNAFDLGILLLFGVYYCLRLYGVVLAEQGKHRIASMAYDVLASTAILLFPRLFSVLDHYRYFSQLLIAFRMMAQDLIAILVLILISCSGFFVAFTLSFSDEATDGNAVAYALFQILMGFTPAAWDHWKGYNMLGKAIMGLFLVICHFLIVTILITVLTNSFMAIVQNANEEHQFLFAINTISMVKSDALFSYVAPTNIFAWIISPLRYIIPFRQFVKTNRYIIKFTHFPILFGIFVYERLILSTHVYEPIDLVEKPATSQAKPLAFSLNKVHEAFSPGPRLLREPSVMSFNKDRALDEVFRRPFHGSTLRTTTREMDSGRRNSTNAVDQWMQVADQEGGASPPMEQPRSVLEQLEQRRPRPKRAFTSERVKQGSKARDFSQATKSVMSDPDVLSLTTPRRPQKIVEESEDLDTSQDTVPQETDADGDYENNDESDAPTPGVGESAMSIKRADRGSGDDDSEGEFFQTPIANRTPFLQPSFATQSRLQDTPESVLAPGPSLQARPTGKRHSHTRNASSATILFAPQPADDSSTSNQQRLSVPSSARNVKTGPTTTPAKFPAGSRTPKLKPAQTKPRPIMPPRQNTAPNNPNGLSFMDFPARRSYRQPSMNTRALDLASEIGDNRPMGGIDGGGISGMPASFGEAFYRDRDLERHREDARRRSEDAEKGMVNRIMLARMHTLEEGFREVLKEIKDMSQAASSSRRDSEVDVSFARSTRSRIDGLGGSSLTLSTSAGAAPRELKTPIGRIGGNDAKVRKSPRKASGAKLSTSSAKAKEVEGESSGAGQREQRQQELLLSATPQSVQSVVDLTTIAEQGLPRGQSSSPHDHEAQERPGTAIRSAESGKEE
nr:calcium channel yvc1 [Quercus suber]